jgi:hypothetical protein
MSKSNHDTASAREEDPHTTHSHTPFQTIIPPFYLNWNIRHLEQPASKDGVDVSIAVISSFVEGSDVVEAAIVVVERELRVTTVLKEVGETVIERKTDAARVHARLGDGLSVVQGSSS